MRSLRFAAAGLLAAVSFGAAPAQPNLPHSTITIDTTKGPVRFSVEVAGDTASRMQGLMYRKQLGANAGMLFDFHGDHFQAFWMKNTILPLDMIFIRADGTISSIASHTIPYSEQPVMSKEPVHAVLEINAGRSDALGIEPGATVHGSIFKNASSN
jgi:uncharacterized membrane protein (UPF0127 family)